MQDFCRDNKDLFVVVAKPPGKRYEKSDNVNWRYQNTDTGGTKSPILSSMRPRLKELNDNPYDMLPEKPPKC